MVRDRILSLLIIQFNSVKIQDDFLRDFTV